MDYRESSNPPADDVLEHYGVKGMRWGVRRTKKQLANASSKAAHDKAVSTLNKHRRKGEAKIQKLSKKEDALQKERNRQIQKDDVKAAKLQRKAAKNRSKAHKWYRSTEGMVRLQIKADTLEAKADRIRSESDLTKRKLDKNHNMQKAFQEQIDLIDKTIAEEGKRFLKAS